MSKQNTLMKNVSFLMMATLISKVIGLLYRSPLSSAIGSKGMGVYGYANNAYIILLLISSYSIPMAVSKIVSERITLKQYRNAYMVFKGSLVYGAVVGGITCAIAVLGGKLILHPKQWDAILALRILGPTIFLSAVLGVFRGYFQAYNTMLPTSISQILEQVANAIVSVMAAWLFVKSFATDVKTQAIYGAAGGTLGTGAGVLAALLFMLLVYAVNRKTIKRQIAHDNSKPESRRHIAKIIILMITPVIFSTCVYNASGYLDGIIFSALAGRSKMEKDLIDSLYGEFSNYYLTLVNIPLSLCSATSSAMLPEVSSLFAMKDIDGVIEKANTAVRLVMFICIPAAVGLGVLSYPIMGALFTKSTAVAGDLLLFGAVSVVFSALSTITNGILQAIGKPFTPLLNAGKALAINLGTLAAVLWFAPELGVYVLLLVNVLFSFCMCVFNQSAMKKHLGYKNQFRESYAKPFLAAAGMGVAAWGVYYGLHLIVPIQIVCLGAAVIIAIVVYLILFVVVSRTSEEELVKFPFGRYAVKFVRVIRIYR